MWRPEQEESLGPLHPDLANTLNNLAVVYETIDQPAEAERCYRRAYSIAIASLEPDHPFIATSEKTTAISVSLVEFRSRPGPRCRSLAPASAPVDVPTPMPAIEHAVDATVPPPIAETKVPRPIAESSVPPPIADSEVSRSRAPVIAGVIGLAAVIIAAGFWFRANGDDETLQTPQASQAAPSPPPSERPAPVAEPAPVEPVAVPRRSPPAVTKSGTERPIESAPPSQTRLDTITENAGRSQHDENPTVDEASLCSELSRRDWRCSPASRPVDSGELFFYTRIKSPSNVTVEHRWYRNDRLERNVRAAHPGKPAQRVSHLQPHRRETR